MRAFFLIKDFDRETCRRTLNLNFLESLLSCSSSGLIERKKMCIWQGRVLQDALYPFVAVVGTLLLSLRADSFGYSCPAFPYICEGLLPRLLFLSRPLIVRLFVYLFNLLFSGLTVTLRGVPCLYYFGHLFIVFWVVFHCLF